ncbi:MULTISPECIES: helix-turn-helix domain-containing protein [unclassified Bradyrhizobium]|uniref:helix-turn-helix domain-containing protein n=1 Tax=unclassified Bradyrhizobium TaxID=2631580 RepID=UPI002915EFB0|nr:MULTISPECIES: helix-turn-helix domain-containing protein [unclassified Bradyrhizobium]
MAKVALWRYPFRPAGLDPVVTEISEAHAGTIVGIDNKGRRRLVEFKDGCRYGKLGKTKAYELIAHERIRAYKMGGKTMIDLDSVDEYHASLPRVETSESWTARFTLQNGGRAGCRDDSDQCSIERTLSSQ